jgi:hypothetical protein
VGVIGIGDIHNRIFKGADAIARAIYDIVYTFTVFDGNTVRYQDVKRRSAYYGGVKIAYAEENVKERGGATDDLICGGVSADGQVGVKPIDEGTYTAVGGGKYVAIFNENAGILPHQEKLLCFF